MTSRWNFRCLLYKNVELYTHRKKQQHIFTHIDIFIHYPLLFLYIVHIIYIKHIKYIISRRHILLSVCKQVNFKYIYFRLFYRLCIQKKSISCYLNNLSLRIFFLCDWIFTSFFCVKICLFIERKVFKVSFP